MKANKRRLNESVDLKDFCRVGRIEITVYNITANQHQEYAEITYVKRHYPVP